MATVAPFYLRGGAVYHFRDDCKYSQGGEQAAGTSNRMPCDECIGLVQRERTDILRARRQG